MEAEQEKLHNRLLYVAISPQSTFPDKCISSRSSTAFTSPQLELAVISLHSHRPFVQSVAKHSETRPKGLRLNQAFNGFLLSAEVANLRQC